MSGDVFGQIYEYFLTQFADQKAHDAGEFFTPISLVSLIAHVLDPERGTVLDPACGSGGMFVQSARIVEEHGQSPTEQLTFRGLEKNATTMRSAKMNLAVHGLEGDIQQANTYYEAPTSWWVRPLAATPPPGSIPEVPLGALDHVCVGSFEQLGSNSETATNRFDAKGLAGITPWPDIRSRASVRRRALPSQQGPRLWRSPGVGMCHRDSSTSRSSPKRSPMSTQHQPRTSRRGHHSSGSPTRTN